MRSLFKPMHKKGQVFEGMKNIFVSLMVLAIVGMIVFLVLAELASNSTVSADGNATNAVHTLQEGGETVVSWVDIGVIVSIGVLLFAMVAYLIARR